MKGCSACKELNYYDNKIAQYRKIIYKYQETLSESKKKREKEFLEKKVSSIFEKIKAFGYSYSKNNPNSKITPYALYWLHTYIGSNEYKYYCSSFNKLPTYQKESFYGIKIKEKVEVYNRIMNQIGMKAPSFCAIDISNKKIYLNSVYSKNYLLLDFWASWCVPCRKGNPHLRELYEKYHPSGFEIISISDDSNSNKWKKAVYEDSIQAWMQVLCDSASITGTDSLDGIFEEYLVEVLPTKILINKRGEIIDRFDDLNEGKLDKKLKKIFHY